MYIRDEHPMRSRVRYFSTRGLRGMGIGPEIVTPEGCVPVLRQSSPPLEGLMTAMTDTYATLSPVMAPLPDRVDCGIESEEDRRFTVLPVEVTSAALDGLRGYGSASSVQQGHAYNGRRASDGTQITKVGFGTCIGC